MTVPCRVSGFVRSNFALACAVPLLFGRRRTALKILLFFDGSGLCIRRCRRFTELPMIAVVAGLVNNRQHDDARSPQGPIIFLTCRLEMI